jgi:hypothetical protein
MPQFLEEPENAERERLENQRADGARAAEVSLEAAPASGTGPLPSP